MASANGQGSSGTLRVLVVVFGTAALAGWGFAFLKMSEAKKDQQGREAAAEGFQEEREDLTAQVQELRGQVEDLESELSETRASTEEIQKVRENLVKEREKLETVLKKEIAEGQAKLEEIQGQLKVTCMDTILFDLGKANIRPEGKEVLDKIATVLLQDKTGRTISVEGHCDNIPISPAHWHLFRTNWELSTARALAVVHYFQDSHQIDPGLLSAVGYGEHRPVAPNDTPEGRQKNRRVEIVLEPEVLES